jgi:hypothetical protein
MYSRRDLLLYTLAGVASTHLARADNPAGPGPRAGHAMAWHAGRRAICLLGGDRVGLPSAVPAEDVWTWDGRHWLRADTSGAGPQAASLVAAAGDPHRGSVLAYGGFRIEGPQKYGAPAGELWELDRGLAWRRHDALGPGPRHHHAMAFDTKRGRLVVYGGIDATGDWPTDVWEWDRSRWQRVESATGPGPRAHHALAFDSRRARVVLRGGTTPGKVQPPDTWEWDGRNWHRSADDGPLPGGGYRMAYDAAREVTVLCGGDTCLWDGRAWTRLATTTSPASRLVHAMAYDPNRRVVVLYGGSVERVNAADTWEWNGTTWAQPRG